MCIYFFHQKGKTLLIMSILLCSVAFLSDRKVDLRYTVTLSWYSMHVVPLYNTCLTCEWNAVYGCRRTYIQHFKDLVAYKPELQHIVSYCLLWWRHCPVVLEQFQFFDSSSDLCLPCYKYAELAFEGWDLLLTLASSANNIWLNNFVFCL